MSAKAAGEQRTNPSTGYYTTSYIFSGASHTIALQIWRMLSDRVADTGEPVTGEELMQAFNLTTQQLESIFHQNYYQKYYGFRHFDTLEEWEAWAKEKGIEEDPDRQQDQEETPEHEQEPSAAQSETEDPPTA